MASNEKKAADEAASNTATDNLNDSGCIFFSVEHDLDCLTIETQSMGDCTCKKIFAKESSQEAWLKGFGKARKERRAAERAAAKAMRRARS